jgi:hypothetical protein
MKKDESSRKYSAYAENDKSSEGFSRKGFGEEIAWKT